MQLITDNMKWIMLVAGAITLTMVFALFAPNLVLNSMFGDTLAGPLAQVLARNWGALIALIGGMLIYGAFNPLQRPLVLVVAGLSKITFMVLVLANGFGQHLAATLVMDCIFVALFICYLLDQPNKALV